MSETQSMTDGSGPDFPLAHIGFVVKDIDKAYKQWTTSGAKPFIAPELDPVQKVWCALVGYPGTAPIELVAPANTIDSPALGRLKRGGGLDHLCYFVDDVAVGCETLQARGGLLVVPPVYGVVFDRTIAFLMMRTGLTIELMARQPAGEKADDPLASYFAATGEPS